MDPRLQKLADILVNYCVTVQPGEWVLLRSPTVAEPLANACVEEILKAGGNPTATFVSEEIMETMLQKGSDEQLAFLDPAARTAVEHVDVLIGILAPVNTRALTTIDPSRLAIQGKAQEPFFEAINRRTAEGELRWTVTAFPTQGGAQDAGMSLRNYEDFIFDAGLLSEPEPRKAWLSLGERQKRIAEWLADKQTVHIVGPGTDLSIGIAGRIWSNDDGHTNFPGGEVFTGPVEDQTEGMIEFNCPGFYNGREVTGVRLVFRDGVIVDAGARTDEAFLIEMLDMDAGARRLGEFAFGLNPRIQRFTKSVLFDEKIGGTIHMALGRSYPETGGTNISALHWDMVYDLRGGGDITVDGQPFSRNGEILI